MSVNESHEQNLYSDIYFYSIQQSNAKHILKADCLFHIITLFHFAQS